MERAMGIDPTGAAPPEPGNERFGGMADPKCDGRVNFRGTWAHVPRKFTRPSHLGSAIPPNRSFPGSGGAAPVGSIPIARSIFLCLACPCVVLGRARAYCL